MAKIKVTIKKEGEDEELLVTEVAAETTLRELVKELDSSGLGEEDAYSLAPAVEKGGMVLVVPRQGQAVSALLAKEGDESLTLCAPIRKKM
mmetsp:Transcript_115824/g.205165  ORF Transcript_115824/g.205165 Transcript_115824/m.205165 type:complete len:91 (-) Transcript_115824:28-300(-)